MRWKVNPSSTKKPRKKIPHFSKYETRNKLTHCLVLQTIAEHRHPERMANYELDCYWSMRRLHHPCLLVHRQQEHEPVFHHSLQRQARFPRLKKTLATLLLLQQNLKYMSLWSLTNQRRSYHSYRH